MNYVPRQTLSIMEAILRDHLDAAERLEGEIADLEADLRDRRTDWAEQSAILKLTAARDRQRERIAKAGETLRTVAVLRERAGLEAHVLTRVFGEMAK